MLNSLRPEISVSVLRIRGQAAWIDGVPLPGWNLSVVTDDGLAAPK